jgi:hypothetical protein
MEKESMNTKTKLNFSTKGEGEKPTNKSYPIYMVKPNSVSKMFSPIYF